MQPYTIERLERAVAVVQAAPERKVELAYIFYSQDRITTDINVCGTTACALGHCAVDPWFNDQGLNLTVDKDGWFWFRVRRGGLRESFGSLAYAEAASAFFGLSWHRADALFGPVEAWEREMDLTDKEVWLRRARDLLHDLRPPHIPGRAG